MNNKQISCPTCQKPVTKEGNASWPFCSERCKVSDLGAWAKEEYRIASNEKPHLKEGEDDDEG